MKSKLLTCVIFCSLAFSQLDVESFEPGNYNLRGWDANSGTKSWLFTQESSTDYSYSLKSDPSIADGDTIILELVFNTGRLSFDFSSHLQPYDNAVFYIDGQYSASLHYTSDTSWKNVVKYVTPGLHTFRWVVTRSYNEYPTKEHFLLLDNIRFGYELDGRGTKLNPYLVSSQDDFAYIHSEFANLSTCHFALTNNLNMLGYGHNSGEEGDNTIEFYSIGVDSNNRFEGVFDGRGHTISHLTYIADTYPFSSYIGIFGVIGVEGIVKNLNVSQFHYDGQYTIGAIAGENYGKIINCNISGIIDSYGQYGAIGGVAARNLGLIQDCLSDIEINAVYGNLGGIAGINAGGQIINCTANNNITCQAGDVSGIADNKPNYSNGAIISNCIANNIHLSGLSYRIGGIACTNQNSCAVIGCRSTGNVYGGNQHVGGIVGNNAGEVLCCSNTANVYGGQYCGGAIGENHSNYKVEYCYSTGDVLPWDQTQTHYSSSGFCGISRTAIHNSYSTGYVESTGGDNNFGFAYAYNKGLIFHCFYNYQTAQDYDRYINTELELYNGAIICNNNSMIDESTFTDRSWNFENMWQMGANGPVHRDSWPTFFANKNSALETITNTESLNRIIDNWAIRAQPDNNWAWATDCNKDGNVNYVDFGYMAKIWKSQAGYSNTSGF